MILASNGGLLGLVCHIMASASYEEEVVAIEQVHDSYMTHMFPVVYTQSIQLLLQFLAFQILMFLRDST